VTWVKPKLGVIGQLIADQDLLASTVDTAYHYHSDDREYNDRPVIGRVGFILLFVFMTDLGNFSHCRAYASVVTVLEDFGEWSGKFWSTFQSSITEIIAVTC